MVFSSGTPSGSAFGFTFTPLPPQSCERTTYAFAPSISFSSRAGSGSWKAQFVPGPTKVTGLFSNRSFTSALARSLRLGLTPWACSTRSSTPCAPARSQLRMRVGRSQSRPHW